MYGRWTTPTAMVKIGLADKPRRSTIVIISGFACNGVGEALFGDYMRLGHSVVLASGPVTPQSIRDFGRRSGRASAVGHDPSAELLGGIRVGLQIATAGSRTKTVHVIAQSVGGAVGTALCSDARSSALSGVTISGLTLVSPFLGLNEALTAGWFVRLQRVVGAHPTLARRIPPFSTVNLEQLVCRGEAIDPGHQLHTRQICRTFDNVPLAGALSLDQFGEDLTERIESLKVPTWVIQGKHDTLGKSWELGWMRSRRNVMAVEEVDASHLALFDLRGRERVMHHVVRLTGSFV